MLLVDGLKKLWRSCSAQIGKECSLYKGVEANCPSKCSSHKGNQKLNCQPLHLPANENFQYYDSVKIKHSERQKNLLIQKVMQFLGYQGDHSAEEMHASLPMMTPVPHEAKH